MATKKVEGKWSTETIGEFKVAGTAAVWRAQVSTAPDGKRFAGIRKYFTKKDGTERADRAGFSLLLNEEDVNQTTVAIAGLSKLLSKLSSSLGVLPKSPKKGKSKPQEDSAVFVLKKGSYFLKSWYKDPDTKQGLVERTKVVEEARSWSSEEEASAWQSVRSKSTAGYQPHEV